MSPRRVETALGAGIVAVFLLLRLTLLVVREPFFDELFTLWMARNPFSAILSALRDDSGPPLYYALARVPHLVALRMLSLVFASAAMALVLTRRSLGPSRFLGAALLAVYSPAVLYAVDARAYALCGLFVGIATLALHERRHGLAAGALVLASYTHYYGVLFLPCLWSRERRGRIAAVVAGILVLPAVALAFVQPRQATEWLAHASPLAPLWTFAFAGRYVPALFAPAPVFVVVISIAAVLAALFLGARLRTVDARMVLVPVLAAVALALADRNVYFPMRFESVLAVPLVLWIATSLAHARRGVRAVLFAILVLLGAAVTVRGTIDHARRDVDPRRQAARNVARFARPDDRIVASGYLLLETMVALPEHRIEACPPERAHHPGWIVPLTPAEAGRAVGALPDSSFVWVGERASPETAALARVRSMRVLSLDDEVVIARVAALDH